MRVRLRVRYCSRACGNSSRVPVSSSAVWRAVRCCVLLAVLLCCATATTGRACAGLRCAVRCCCVSVGGRGAIYLFCSLALCVAAAAAVARLLCVCLCGTLCATACAPAPPAHRVAVCLLCVLCNTLILAIRSRSLIRYSVSHSLRSALRYRTACCVAYAAYRYCYTQQLLSFTH